MMIESMAGKSASLNGVVYDATPFTYSEDDPAVDYFGNLLKQCKNLAVTFVYLSLPATDFVSSTDILKFYSQRYLIKYFLTSSCRTQDSWTI